MNLSSLLRALPAHEIQNARDIDISRITAASRQVIAGALFVAIPGEKFDGAQFIPEAISRGAVAIVAEALPSVPLVPSIPIVTVPNSRLALAHLCSAFYDNPSRKLRVIGVTGTDGKTTTCALVASILRAAGHRVGAITTVSAQIGDEEIDTGFHTTTPDAPEIQRYLAQMVAAEMQYAVIECTSHGLAQHRLDAIDFDIAVVTNIQHEHLDYHKTFENYREAKAMLFRSLATSHRKARTAKVAVLNAEDAERGVFEFLKQIPVDEQVIYGVDSKFIIHNSKFAENHELRMTNYEFAIAENIEHSTNGLSFTVKTAHGDLSVQSPLLGRYNVSNILAALGVGIARRVPFDAMRAGIANVRGIIGRMEIIQREPFAAIVDFAHTPNALRVALETAQEITRGTDASSRREVIKRSESSNVREDASVIVVFGCAGLRDAQKRALMGEVAGKLADKIVITAEDPRTESLDAINAQIAQGLERAGRRARADYFIVNDRAEAIAFAAQMARAGDVVIVTGKGHERSICFGETEYPWSDQEALIAALKNQKRVD